MPREALTSTASPGCTRAGSWAAAAAASSNRWTAPRGRPARRGALRDLPAQGPHRGQELDAARVLLAAAPMDLRRGGAELEHVAQHGHPALASGQGQGEQRGIEGLGARVVAVVDEDDVPHETLHLAAVFARGEAGHRFRHGRGGHSESVAHRRRGQEVQHEVGAGQGQGHVGLLPVDHEVEAPAEGRAAPVLARDLMATVAAEPEHWPGEGLADAAHPRVVAVQHCPPLRPQALQDLRLGLRHLVRGAEELEVGAAHVGDDGEVGRGDRRSGRGARRSRTCPARAPPPGARERAAAG